MNEIRQNLIHDTLISANNQTNTEETSSVTRQFLGYFSQSFTEKMQLMQKWKAASFIFLFYIIMFEATDFNIKNKLIQNTFFIER